MDDPQSLQIFVWAFHTRSGKINPVSKSLHQLLVLLCFINIPAKPMCNFKQNSGKLSELILIYIVEASIS